MDEKCVGCGESLKYRPPSKCLGDYLRYHWQAYAIYLEDKLDMEDDSRDKMDVAEWIENLDKVRSYKCHGCGRDYDIPTHLNHFICICGHQCRLRHLGGTDSYEAVIDAARDYFGNERSANLAWIAEIIAGEHGKSYSSNDIRKMISNEMDRWALKSYGWEKK